MAARRSLQSIAKSVAIALVALLATASVAAVAYIRLNETDRVFPRELAREGYPRPADSLRLPYSTVTFRTADSITLASWIVPASTNSAGLWVLLCHGQTGNLATTTRPQYYAYLRSIGVHILAFDWRGFGASDGTPSEAGLYRDATAAYEYLRRELRVPPDSIIIFGHSLGTAPAVELATRVSAAGLVLEGAPSSVIGRAQELYPLLPMRLLAATRFESVKRIGDVRMPILFLHATADARIPIAHGRRLFDGATAPKRLVELAGEHHNAFLRDSATYFGAYATFVQDLRSRRAF